MNTTQSGLLVPGTNYRMPLVTSRPHGAGVHPTALRPRQGPHRRRRDPGQAAGWLSETVVKVLGRTAPGNVPTFPSMETTRGSGHSVAHWDLLISQLSGYRKAAGSLGTASEPASLPSRHCLSHAELWPWHSEEPEDRGAWNPALSGVGPELGERTPVPRQPGKLLPPWGRTKPSYPGQLEMEEQSLK